MWRFGIWAKQTVSSWSLHQLMVDDRTTKLPHRFSDTQKMHLVKVAERETAAWMQIQSTTTKILSAFFSPSLWSQTRRRLYSNNTGIKKRRKKGKTSDK